MLPARVTVGLVGSGAAWCAASSWRVQRNRRCRRWGRELAEVAAGGVLEFAFDRLVDSDADRAGERLAARLA
jgi:hypothetical protein